MTSAILTPSFFARYRVVPSHVTWQLLARALRLHMGVVGFRVDVENVGRIPDSPALLCTNSTHTYDFIALMKGLDQVGKRVITISKAKNFHSPAMAFVMKRAGVVPLASRGYFLLADFLSVHGRRPTDLEYRALRLHLDEDRELPNDDVFHAILTRKRTIADHGFSPSTSTWRRALLHVFESAMHETMRLARTAINAGFLVQIYPEGTVNRHLGIGRAGAVQLSHALNLPLVPVGMSGSPEAFLGRTPIPRHGRVIVRVGERLDAGLPANHRAFRADDERRNRESIDAATARLMGAIEGLIDEKYRPSGPFVSKGTRALL
jgi:1-acyl-sn-glycerol-3-phosphate acyltransferase